MSNILTFPTGGRPTENVREIHNPSFPYRRGTARPGYTPSGRPNMHTLFRSYSLIVESDEADLARDVGFDIVKAQSKLKAIRRQLQRDREHAAARAELLTSAENKLSAAIDAALLSARRPSEG